MPDLGLIVVSYNTCELTRGCLESVVAGLEHSRLEGEIYVVDNASRDGSADMVRRSFPMIHLIASEKNLGFAAANNLALRAMGFDGENKRDAPAYVMLLNPDTQVLGDALGVLLRFMRDTPQAGMAGASLQYADGRFQHSAFRFPSLAQVFFDFFPVNYRFTNSRLNGRYPRSLYERRRPFPIDHPLGAAMMVRGETIRQVGLLDPKFFMYCEEIDWCMRMKAAGWEIYCVPEARIIHHEAQSTRQFRARMFVELWRSRFHLFRKHYGPFYNRVVRLIVRLGLWREIQRIYRSDMPSERVEEALRAYEEVWHM